MGFRLRPPRLRANGRTVFIIAHRMSMLRRAHRIINVERGRIIEDGTHDELLRKAGRCAALDRLQGGLHEVRVRQVRPPEAIY
jgi:ATP-binding cassette, subfamily B, bacterial HlyB/CyaB